MKAYLLTAAGLVIACFSAYAMGYAAGRGMGPVLHYVAADIDGCEWPSRERPDCDEYDEFGSCVVDVPEEMDDLDVGGSYAHPSLRFKQLPEVQP